MADCPRCNRSSTILFNYREHRGMTPCVEHGRQTVRPAFADLGEVCWPCYSAMVQARLKEVRRGRDRATAVDNPHSST